MKNKNNFLFRKRKGEAAMESVILAPLMMMALILMLYLLLMAVDNIFYNNYANTLAMDLNQRQTSVVDIMSDCNSRPVLCQNPIAINPGGNSQHLKNLKPSDDNSVEYFLNQINLQGGSSAQIPVYINGVRADSNTGKPADRVVAYLYNHRLKNGYVPGAFITKMEINFTKNGNNWNYLNDMAQVNDLSAGKLSGTQIEVIVYYKCLGFEFSSRGYNIIT